MIPDQYRDKVAKIKELYHTAEADLKDIGREKQAIVVTGINQCRYVAASAKPLNSTSPPMPAHH